MVLGCLSSREGSSSSACYRCPLRLPDTKHVHVVPKVCHVYVLRESRKSTIGIANDSNAEADVDTDGSPTRLPGLGT
jgi:hypothetical protein